jgi:hypothetical protein
MVNICIEYYSGISFAFAEITLNLLSVKITITT